MYILILSARQTKTITCANSVDPDEMAHNELSHQDLHCSPFCLDFRLKQVFALVVMFKFKIGRVHFINSGMKGLRNHVCS